MAAEINELAGTIRTLSDRRDTALSQIEATEQFLRAGGGRCADLELGIQRSETTGSSGDADHLRDELQRCRGELAFARRRLRNLREEVAGYEMNIRDLGERFTIASRAHMENVLREENQAYKKAFQVFSKAVVRAVAVRRACALDLIPLHDLKIVDIYGKSLFSMRGGSVDAWLQDPEAVRAYDSFGYIRSTFQLLQRSAMAPVPLRVPSSVSNGRLPAVSAEASTSLPAPAVCMLSASAGSSS